MTRPIFITGIGTGVGKTPVAAIVTEALGADYWKPVQAGFSEGTDTDLIKHLLTHTCSRVHDELYKLNTPASPHIAAGKDGITIEANNILQTARSIMESAKPKQLVIESAGGLLVPLADGLMMADIISQLNARVILVSRNYLGSINHSLLTAAFCKCRGIDVLGWIFNDDYMHYEEEIVEWSGYPSLVSIPKLTVIDPVTIRTHALGLQTALFEKLKT